MILNKIIDINAAENSELPSQEYISFWTYS